MSNVKTSYGIVKYEEFLDDEHTERIETSSWAVVTYMENDGENRLLSAVPYSVVNYGKDTEHKRFYAPLDQEDLSNVTSWLIGDDYMHPNKKDFEDENVNDEREEDQADVEVASETLTTDDLIIEIPDELSL